MLAGFLRDVLGMASPEDSLRYDVANVPEADLPSTTASETAVSRWPSSSLTGAYWLPEDLRYFR